MKKLLRKIRCHWFGHVIGKSFACGTVLRFYRCDRCMATLMEHEYHQGTLLRCTDADVMEVLEVNATFGKEPA